MKKSEESLRDLREKKGVGYLFKEIIAENFSNLGKEMDIHIQQAP